jgi:hypothetical protein
MSRARITFVAALAMVAVARVGLADKERCKVKIGDEYRFLESTYTKGGCEVEAKKYAGPRVCETGDQYFDVRYSFDGTVYEAEHLHCRLYMGSGTSTSSTSSSSKERCKVKIGDDYRFLERTYTKGGCEVEAKKYAGPRVCETGDQYFDVKYSFDDTVYEAAHLHCKLYMGSGASSSSEDVPPRASVNGKYSNLLQVVNCPSHAQRYGQFTDYGHWDGGPWCGKTGKAGYWVWLDPNWYVWSEKN